VQKVRLPEAVLRVFLEWNTMFIKLQVRWLQELRGLLWKKSAYWKPT